MALTAHVHITTGLYGDATFLKSSFAMPPFKIANVSEGSKQLKLILMNASPGMLDGDDYVIDVTVTNGTSLKLQTQSYQRIFQMRKGAAQKMNVVVEDAATLFYLPHPTVPHQAAIYKAVNKIFLRKSSNLIWGEILCCGRKLNGEVFRFTSYHNITEVWMENKLVVKENLLLQPQKLKLNGIGQLEGFTHQASLVCITENCEDAWLDVLQEQIGSEDDIASGITALPVRGFLLRVLGYKAEQLFELLQRVATWSEKKIAHKKNVHAR